MGALCPFSRSSIARRATSALSRDGWRPRRMNNPASDGSPKLSEPSPGAGFRPTRTLSTFFPKDSRESGEFAPSCTRCGADCERIVVIRVPCWRFLFFIIRIFLLCSHVSCLVSLTIHAVLGNDPFTQKSFRSMDDEILKNSWVDFTLCRYSKLELKPSQKPGYGRVRCACRRDLCHVLLCIVKSHDRVPRH